MGNLGPRARKKGKRHARWAKRGTATTAVLRIGASGCVVVDCGATCLITWEAYTSRALSQGGHPSAPPLLHAIRGISRLLLCMPPQCQHARTATDPASPSGIQACLFYRPISPPRLLARLLLSPALFPQRAPRSPAEGKASPLASDVRAQLGCDVARTDLPVQRK
ncbi:hypothetical protein NDU88_004284 [Pleurodeles waltl]|uniref:Uncharacterized protein n=1 Tax=Pleurodeles waltl TaxID=8319 RepID=A0AAV7WW39_PLEWA|nr:hypothetical protein NDU88_004284 [Pleurodeles waltl]